MELDLENDASVFDAGECETAETATAKPVLSLQLAQAAPAMDVSRIEVRKTGEGALLGVLDIEQRIGVGNKTAGTDADDFQQGCVAVTAHSFNENEQDYVLDVRFGGDWTAGSYMVSLLNVRGETREYTLDAN